MQDSSQENTVFFLRKYMISSKKSSDFIVLSKKTVQKILFSYLARKKICSETDSEQKQYLIIFLYFSDLLRQKHLQWKLLPVPSGIPCHPDRSCSR